MTLCCNGLEVLVSKGEMLQPGDRQTKNSIELELRTVIGLFWAPDASKSTKKGITVLDGVILFTNGEIGLLLHHEGKGNYV